MEYRRRYRKSSSWEAKYKKIPGSMLGAIARSCAPDKYEATIRYLLDAKKDKLTVKDLVRLGVKVKLEEKEGD